MNKLKDIIYDKNDLLIALLILLCAAFVIYGKIDAIMDYPSTLEASALTETEEETVQYTGSTEDQEESASQDGEEENAGTTENEETDTPAGTSDEPSGESADEPDSTNTSSEKITVTIDYGATGSDIAQILVNAGLLDSRQEFYDAVNKAGADTRLKAGEFNIPLNATPDEIISIITQ